MIHIPFPSNSTTVFSGEVFSIPFFSYEIYRYLGSFSTLPMYITRFSLKQKPTQSRYPKKKQNCLFQDQKTKKKRNKQKQQKTAEYIIVYYLKEPSTKTRKKHTCHVSFLFGRWLVITLIFQVHSLKLTASLPLKIGRAPKGKDHLPTIHFQGQKC